MLRFRLVALVAALLQPVYALALDGNDLKRAVSAYERVNIAKTSISRDDQDDCTMLLSYVGGMLAVHRSNNFHAMILFSMMKPKTGEQRMSEANEASFKTMLMFTPLLKIPDDLPADQVVAILKKFLDANPERWKEQAAPLIEDALKSAFPAR